MVLKEISKAFWCTNCNRKLFINYYHFQIKTWKSKKDESNELQLFQTLIKHQKKLKGELKYLLNCACLDLQTPPHFLHLNFLVWEPCWFGNHGHVILGSQFFLDLHSKSLYSIDFGVIVNLFLSPFSVMDGSLTKYRSFNSVSLSPKNPPLLQIYGRFCPCYKICSQGKL